MLKPWAAVFLWACAVYLFFIVLGVYVPWAFSALLGR